MSCGSPRHELRDSECNFEATPRPLRGGIPRSAFPPTAEALADSPARVRGFAREIHPERERGMTFNDGLNALLAHLRLDGYSPSTIDNYGDQLKRFGEWSRRQRIGDLRALTRARLLAYQGDVRSEPISRETQALRIRAVKRLYGHLVAQGHLLLDPTEGIQEISRRQALPKPILSATEMKRLLAAPDVSRPSGIRDRALLEVLYATGVRVGELERVACQDLDLREGTMHLRFTKGGRPRVVPLGRNASRWLQRYVDEVRPKLVQ